MEPVGSAESRTLASLTDEQRAWLLRSEGLWRRAHSIVLDRLDLGDVHHALRNLLLPPAERLRRGLTRVRVRPHTRCGRLDPEKLAEATRRAGGFYTSGFAMQPA